MATANRERFEAIIEPHFSALYRTAFRLAQNREDAEDLVQDLCLRVLTELSNTEVVEHPRAWLLRIQYRIFIDDTRRRSRSPVQRLPDDADANGLLASDAPALDEITDGIRQQQELSEAWKRLERDQRALLALHAEGYSLDELQAIVGISKNAISARLHRARARFAKLLRAGSIGLACTGTAGERA